jgi:hypothetical protein
VQTRRKRPQKKGKWQQQELLKHARSECSVLAWQGRHIPVCGTGCVEFHVLHPLPEAGQSGQLTEATLLGLVVAQEKSHAVGQET